MPIKRAFYDYIYEFWIELIILSTLGSFIFVIKPNQSIIRNLTIVTIISLFRYA